MNRKQRSFEDALGLARRLLTLRAMSSTKNTQELKERIEAKKKELQADWERLKADTRSDARERREQIESKLSELREATASGVENLTDRASAKINEILKK